jgi:Tol biopolymer transport system component
MGETSFVVPPAEAQPGKRLDSWKEIAAHLNRDVTTAQRWERLEGMPVHRHLHAKRGSVYALSDELDAWMRSRSLRTEQGNGGDLVAPDLPSPAIHPAVSAGSTRWKPVLLVAATGAVLAIGACFWLQRTDYFWHNPLEKARFQAVTDFDGVEQPAAVSRDGHLIAFLSDRDGQMDVWVTQVGSGQFHNLTRGSMSELRNPSIRTLGFSPDGSLVTFWARKQNVANGQDINVWGVPTLGGQPSPYLDGVAEFDWSLDGSQLAYHTPGPGDPLFVSLHGLQPANRPIFTAPVGLHAHFPTWSPDKAFIYFVYGTLPDKLDIWRIHSTGGTAERITSHNARVMYPVMLNRHILMYLASDPDGSGPWLYAMDVERRIPHQLASGFARYTSLSASADGRRLVVTLGRPVSTLWRWRIADSDTGPSMPTQISLNTGTGSSPRLGQDYLLYVAENGTGENIWKIANDGSSKELWSGAGMRILGAPAISPDGHSIAFSVKQQSQTYLYVMQADGTGARVLKNSLDLEGAPAWAPDELSITSAVMDHGVPRLFRVPLDGRSPAPFVEEYSVDPTWAPDGRFVLYSGPDIGTRFSVKAVTAEAAPHLLPALTLSRGARHLAFLAGTHTIVALLGEIQHKDLWQIDLDTGVERQLTHLPPGFDIQEFDISPDGREVILERVQEHSDIEVLDLPPS